MSASAGQVAGQLAYSATPILLTNGIASSLGGVLPIIALTEGANFIVNLLTGSNPLSLDNLFASFMVLPGGTLVANEIPMYPLANQVIAANAIISDPLSVSLIMNVPARGSYGMIVKLATMTALQKAIQQHVTSGGTFTVVTPSYIYSNCLLQKLTDVTSGDMTQQQVTWQWDFVQPLVTQAAAQTAQNSLMSKLTGGQPLTNGTSWSSGSLPVGNPSSLTNPVLVPQ